MAARGSPGWVFPRITTLRTQVAELSDRPRTRLMSPVREPHPSTPKLRDSASTAEPQSMCGSVVGSARRCCRTATDGIAPSAENVGHQVNHQAKASRRKPPHTPAVTNGRWHRPRVSSASPSKPDPASSQTVSDSSLPASWSCDSSYNKSIHRNRDRGGQESGPRAF